VVVSVVTVDSQTMSFLACRFTIAEEGAIHNTTIATLASQTSFTLTAGSADNNAYVGCLAIVHAAASAVQQCIGYVSAYTGATKTVTMAADPGVYTMAAGDNISMRPAQANVLAWNGTKVATPATAGYPVSTLKVGTGTGEVNLTSGKAPATIASGDSADLTALKAALVIATGTCVSGAADGSTVVLPNTVLNLNATMRGCRIRLVLAGQPDCWRDIASYNPTTQTVVPVANFDFQATASTTFSIVGIPNAANADTSGTESTHYGTGDLALAAANPTIVFSPSDITDISDGVSAELIAAGVGGLTPAQASELDAIAQSI
jgi:hypothetical protein